MSSTTIDSFSYRTAPRPGAVRLTRRGKVVVFLFALLALLGVAFLGAGIAGAASNGGQLGTHQVTVRPGETLWGLASAAAHGGDVRDMEVEIQDLNGLSTPTVYAGQQLIIPN